MRAHHAWSAGTTIVWAPTGQRPTGRYDLSVTPTGPHIQVGDSHPEVRAPRRYCRYAMARRRTLESQPRAHLAPGEIWPEGQLADDAPAAADFARRLALKLKQECKNAGNLSMNATADPPGP